VNRPFTQPNYILIGHVTCDVLDDGTTALGGTASYATLTAGVLGFSVGLLTSVSTDLDTSVLAPVADIVVSPALKTTTFKNIYLNGSRQQYIYHLANKLEPRLLPECWKAPLIAHIGPIFNECNLDLLSQFRDGTYLGVTLQGWLREKKPDGRVIPRFPQDGLGIFRGASAVIISEDDIQGNWRYAETLARATPLLIVTCGARGGFIYEHNQRTAFSAPRVKEVNPTGAGDIFAAAFFYAATRGCNACTAASFASCLAARSVTRTGLASVPTTEEVRQCSLLIPEV
jgi:sugar/nucleoside kinase (ribokinase family)